MATPQPTDFSTLLHYNDHVALDAALAGSVLLPGSPTSFIVVASNGGARQTLSAGDTTFSMSLMDGAGSDLSVSSGIVHYNSAGFYQMYVEVECSDFHTASGSWPDTDSACGSVRCILAKPNTSFLNTGFAVRFNLMPPPIGKLGQDFQYAWTSPIFYKTASSTQAFVQATNDASGGSIQMLVTQYIIRLA